MACMHMAVLQALSILSLASMPMLVAGSAEEEAPSGYRFDLIHVDANGNFSREELIHRAVDRTRLRAAMLSAEDDDTDNSPAFSAKSTGPEKYGPHHYLIELEIGTPPETVLVVADTGSELVWTNQMKTCPGSSSFTTTNEPCSDDCRAADKHCNSCILSKTYGGGMSAMKGFVGKETLTLPTRTDKKKKKQKEVALVCALEWSDGILPESAQGIAGLSRGPLSLVKKLGVTKFSYCLSDPLEPELRSPFWFDFDLGQGAEAGWNTTPLVEISPEHRLGSASASANRYYVQLDKICIKDEGACNQLKKEEDFKFKGENKGLMFVDSGCPYTHLDSSIFAALKKLLFQVLKVKVKRTEDGWDCFETPPDSQPDLILKFTGADMHLPWANYVSEVDKRFCLTIWDSDKSILGNWQQQNLYMLYGLTQGEEKLSFQRVKDCSKLLN